MMKRGKKDHRTSNLTRRQGVREIKQSFLIVCEGEKTEPDYFKAFRMTAATIKAVGQAMKEEADLRPVLGGFRQGRLPVKGLQPGHPVGRAEWVPCRLQQSGF